MAAGHERGRRTDRDAGSVAGRLAGWGDAVAAWRPGQQLWGRGSSFGAGAAAHRSSPRRSPREVEDGGRRGGRAGRGRVMERERVGTEEGKKREEI
jgi:hypothetical protein